MEDREGVRRIYLTEVRYGKISQAIAGALSPRSVGVYLARDHANVDRSPTRAKIVGRDKLSSFRGSPGDLAAVLEAT